MSAPDMNQLTGITPEEAQLMEETAFYENLMDEFDLATAEELAAGQDFTEFDANMMSRAMGVFDKASAYYSEDDARLMNVIETVGARLELLGCNHEHFMEQIQERVGKHEDAHNDPHANHGHGSKTAGGTTAPHSVRSSRKSGGGRERRAASSKAPSVTISELIMRYFNKKSHLS